MAGARIKFLKTSLYSEECEKIATTQFDHFLNWIGEHILMAYADYTDANIKDMIQKNKENPEKLINSFLEDVRSMSNARDALNRYKPKNPAKYDVEQFDLTIKRAKELRDKLKNIVDTKLDTKAAEPKKEQPKVGLFANSQSSNGLQGSILTKATTTKIPDQRS